jgi:hypothetical protein
MKPQILVKISTALDPQILDITYYFTLLNTGLPRDSNPTGRSGQRKILRKQTKDSLA